MLPPSQYIGFHGNRFAFHQIKTFWIYSIDSSCTLREWEWERDRERQRKIVCEMENVKSNKTTLILWHKSHLSHNNEKYVHCTTAYTQYILSSFSEIEKKKSVKKEHQQEKIILLFEVLDSICPINLIHLGGLMFPFEPKPTWESMNENSWLNMKIHLSSN